MLVTKSLGKSRQWENNWISTVPGDRDFAYCGQSWKKLVWSLVSWILRSIFNVSDIEEHFERICLRFHIEDVQQLTYCRNNLHIQIFLFKFILRDFFLSDFDIFILQHKKKMQCWTLRTFNHYSARKS